MDVLQSLDAADKSILDRSIIYDKEACACPRTDTRGYLVTIFGRIPSEYTGWLIQRGFYAEFLLAKRQYFDIEICAALFNTGVHFPVDTPLRIAEYGNFDVVKWLYTNVSCEWGDPKAVFKEAV